MPAQIDDLDDMPPMPGDPGDFKDWPLESHHRAARKLIPQLGRLSMGHEEPVEPDGPMGAPSVAMPGVLLPEEFDPKRRAS